LRRRVFLAVGGFAALSAAGYLLLGSPVFSRDTCLWVRCAATVA
jgi:hypothetical protein